MDRLWTEYTLEDRVTYFWQIGLRRLWVMHREDEWLVASELLEDEPEEQIIYFETREKPEELTWQRILCKTDSPRMRLVPMTPDKPVVVGSEYPVTIMPKNQGMFYLFFRSWIALQVGEGFKTTLLEIPSIQLSNSWFGDPDTGIACYALKTSARRSVQEEKIPGFKIICPIQIVNHSPESLDFEKICVHVEHLKIYSNGDQLWSNQVRISFQGEDKGSFLKYSDKTPESHMPDGEGLTLMSSYRKSPKNNLLKRSLTLIRDLTDLRGM